MRLLPIIKSLESLKNYERFEVVLDYLKQLDVPYQIQDYHTGVNVWAPSKTQPYLGVSCHFDVVPNSPGANDNASSIAVCLELLRRYRHSHSSNIGLQVYFFDEEETGLCGSKAYVAEFGLEAMIGLINLELVGMGDRFALWPVANTQYGKVLKCFEEVSKNRKVTTNRFDQIVTNTADHVSFQEAGLEDVFTITCVSDKDLEIAQHYYKALELNTDRERLKEIMSEAPLFKHYHQPTDLANYLKEETLQMTVDSIWDTFINLDKRW